MEWARKHFELATPSARGSSNLAAHVRQLAKSGKAPQWAKDLSTKTREGPPSLEALWRVFCALSRRRRQGFGGPEPLSDLDVLAWESGYGCRLMVWERELLFELDAIFLEVWHDRSRKSRDSDSRQRHRGRSPRSR